MNRIVIYISLIILVLGSCKKVDLQPPVQNNPVFSVDAILNNDSLNWGAGNDNFYMFTEFSKDSFNVYTMTGRLAKDTGCISNCEEYLSISFRSSYATSTINQFDIDQALNVVSPVFFKENQNTISGYRYTFNGEVEDNVGGMQADSIQWELPGGNQSGNTIIYDYTGNQDFNVKMTATMINSNCTVELERTIPFDLSGVDSCLMVVNSTLDSLSNTLFLNIDMPLSPNPNFIWQNGNIINNPDSFIVTLALGGPANSYSLTGSNPFGCTTNMNLCIGGSPNQISTVAIPKFSYGVEPLNVGDPGEQFSAVTIEYFDGNKLYSSKLGENSNSIFTISNIEDFEENENGEKTKKLDVNFNCLLYDESGNSSIQFSGESAIGIAYPNN